MKIKRSLVVLLAMVFSFSVAPRLACADEVVPDTLTATEQMSFFPLAYITIFLGAIMLCSVVVSIIYVSKYKSQESLVCHNYACQSNPKAREDIEGVFDYRQIETPKELMDGYHVQSELAKEEAIKRIVSEFTPPRPAYVGKHQRTTPDNSLVPKGSLGTLPRTATVSQERVFDNQQVNQRAASDQNAFTAPMPRIVLLPDLKKTPPQETSARTTDVPAELEYLLRKIS